MLIYFIIGIVVLIVICTFCFYNSFVKLNIKVKEAFSTMDVYLKKRWDLIPNIVEVVKGYAKHEKDIFVEFASARNVNYNNMSMEDKLNTNNQISNNITRLMALVEKYPDLKADKSFRDLNKQLIIVEDEIANSRKYYNGMVKIYNTKVELFPNNIFAKLFGFKSQKMFESNSYERQNVKVEL